MFLIDFKIEEDNTISITIDGDDGVLVEDCIFISRSIDNELDREEQDFSLEVASCGATTPLTHKRQYVKNIGRTLEVKTKDHEKIEAILTDSNEDGIVLEWKTREPKTVGKGKVTVKKQAEIPFGDILEAQVIIKF